MANPNWYMRTDTPRVNLRERSIRSGFIQIGAQAVQLVLIVGSGMILARLLRPEDFGLLAMVGSLTAFVDSFRDFGIPMATVHRKTVDHQQVSALFWVTLKLNILIGLLMALMAPVLAWFYGETRLTAITLVMAAGIFCLGLSDQHKSLLTRQMRFGSLTLIDTGSILTGLVVGIGLALLGASYWALAFQFLATTLTRSVATWLVSGWRPAWQAWRLRRLNPDLRSMLSYGAHLTGFRVLAHIGRNLDRVLVGYFSGATVVGLYDNAYRWSQYPVSQVYPPLVSVAVSGLSRMQDDPEAYRASFKKALLPVFSVVMPALAFMFVEAQSAVLVLLGDQWLEAVPLFRLLCIAAFATSMTRVTKWLYLSRGETKRQFRWGLIYNPVMVLAVAIGVRWGAFGVAVGYTVATCLLTYPEIAFCLKTSHLSRRDFLGAAWRPALASVAAAILLLASSAAISSGSNLATELLIKLAAFGLAYLILSIGLPGGKQATADVLSIVAELWPKTYRKNHKQNVDKAAGSGRMSIAFIVWEFPVLSETFILNQITGLIDRGHKVDIYALNGRAIDTSKMHPDMEKYHLLDDTYYVPKIPAKYFVRVLKGLGLVLANGHRGPFVLLRSLNVFAHGKQSASLRLLYTTIPFLGKGRYDIIHCQFGTMGLEGLLLRSIGAFKGKLISSFRGYDISQYLKEYGDDVYNELFNTGDFFLTNCEYFKRRLIRLGCDEKKVIVHASGIDCETFALTPRRPHPDGRIRIVTTGRLVEKKGIEYGIRAVAKLVKINGNVEYNIIGDGPLRRELQRLIQELDVHDSVKLLGQKHQQEIITILSSSDILMAPSVTAGDGNQDAPVNTLKEAMAMGLPVIGTQHGGIPELVENGISGFLVPERDADAIAEKLTYLIERPEIWPQMGRAGRWYVEEQYNIVKLNDKLVEIYRQVLAGDRSAAGEIKR